MVSFCNCVIHEVSMAFGANREISMDELIKALETAFKDDGIDIDIKYYDVEDDRPGVEKDEDEEDEEE